MSQQLEYVCDDSQEGQTLAACLRQLLPGRTWAQVRQLVSSRRVRLGKLPGLNICQDPARRMHAGEYLLVTEHSAPPLPKAGALVIRHMDSQVVVVEKPAGIPTVRHPAERGWKDGRKELVPCLDDLVLAQIRLQTGPGPRGPSGRLRIVHRIDKETSGLVVFARTVEAERSLGGQFRAHKVKRRYFAILVGRPENGIIRSFLVRDRGDGRRGSSIVAGVGKEAITHLEVIKRLGDGGPYQNNRFTLVCCRLETGKTHQIRIHTSELGHPVAGDPVYMQPMAAPLMIDNSGAPRLALHAAELGFEHPATGDYVSWEMPLPPDLARLVEALGKNQRGPGRQGVWQEKEEDEDEDPVA